MGRRICLEIRKTKRIRPHAGRPWRRVERGGLVAVGSVLGSGWVPRNPWRAPAIGVGCLSRMLAMLGQNRSTSTVSPHGTHLSFPLPRDQYAALLYRGAGAGEFAFHLPELHENRPSFLRRPVSVLLISLDFGLVSGPS